MPKQGELDELEREEFFRLKKVQAKKKRDASLNDAAVRPASCPTCCCCPPTTQSALPGCLNPLSG